MMRSALAIIVLFAACCAISQTPEAAPATSKAAVQKDQDKTKAQDVEKDAGNDSLIRSVLRNAHALAPQLSPTDRVELLLRLAETAWKSQPETAKQWAREALRLSNEMRPSLRRARYQVKAVSEIAEIDSKEALALLPTLEIPASAKHFDPRTTAATAVFRAFLNQHPDDWEQLSPVATAMGESGHYPFQAINTVITFLQRTDEDAAAALMLHAVSFYNRSEHTPVANLRLAALLSEHYGLLPGSALKATLDALLANLQHPDQAREDAATNSEETQSNAIRDAALALLMPLIGSVDPDLHQKLIQANPSLGTSPLVVDLDGEPAILQRLDPQNGDNVVVATEKKDNQPSPENSDTAQPEEDGDSATVFSAASEKEVSALLGDTETALKSTADSEDRLQVLVGRGLALAAGEKSNELAGLLEEAFPLGEELFRKSVDKDRQASWDGRPGASELILLVEATARTAPRAMIERIQSLRTPVLQAQLFVSLADALQSPELSRALMVMRTGHLPTDDSHH